VHRIQPLIEAALKQLKESNEKRDMYTLALELHGRIRELASLFDDVMAVDTQGMIEKPSTSIASNALEQFCKTMEEILHSWHYPELDRVVFSEKDMDVIISGTRRTNHGKGIRAITHAAFNLALMKYCVDKELPHPGLVLFDSPLVVYREPDEGESGFAPVLKEEFYRATARDFKDQQVIIMENDDPPTDIAENPNIILFTKSDQGRYGFFPNGNISISLA